MSRHQTRISRLERHRTRRAASSARVNIPDDQIAFAELLGVDPDDWQRDVLTSTESHIILNCARQSGKSTVVAIRALYEALTHKESLVLILSPSLRQSAELLKKVADYHSKLGRPDDIFAASATKLTFRNRSRIRALPGSESTTRGFSNPSLVLVDEAAQVSDDLYYSIRPLLAVSGGQLILLSTPRGKRGAFWRAWDQEPGWHPIKVTADDCPRIDPEFIKRERLAVGDWWVAQEYYCEFLQDHAAVFKEKWVQYYDRGRLPEMDTIIQSWDTAATKSTTSDFVVGQVWGRKGGDYYLLDQVRGRYDFDETAQMIQELSAKWRESTAKLVEAQTLGAALSSHLKNQIPGLIPINVKGSKEERARNCMPLWHSGNVYLPHPEDCEWVRDFVRELCTFPNGANDDQVDAMTLALNQLRGSLFPTPKACVSHKITAEPRRGHTYSIGLVAGRLDESSTLVLFDRDTNEVVHFERTPHANKIQRLRRISKSFDAFARANDGYDEATLTALEWNEVYVQRVKWTPQERAAAYENLSMLIRKQAISYPLYRELIAELDVFKSYLTFSGVPDYSLQIAQQSAVEALCLVTYDISPEQPLSWVPSREPQPRYYFNEYSQEWVQLW